MKYIPSTIKRYAREDIDEALNCVSHNMELDSLSSDVLT